MIRDGGGHGSAGAGPVPGDAGMVGWIDRLGALAGLEGELVTLEPLSPAHVDPLCSVGLDEDLWRWAVSRVHDRAGMESYVRSALHDREHGSAFPYAIIHRASGAAAGSTRFGNIDGANRRLEIGWTWLGREYQRTGTNTEAKYLLLRTAFEELGCVRVELKTDALNERSRAAIRRIGATEEGVLRRHMMTATGRFRDTVYYSILDTEWPAVRDQLVARLQGNH